MTLRRTGIQRRVAISRGSAPQGVSAKRKSQRVELVALRLHVLERDGYRCLNCRTRTKPLEVHHIEKRSQRPDLLLEPLNCVSLCAGPGGCHAWTDADPMGKQGRLKIERLSSGAIYFWIDYEGKLARLAGALFLPGSTNQALVENQCITSERSGDAPRD